MRVLVTFFLLSLLSPVASAQSISHPDSLLAEVEGFLARRPPEPDSAARILDAVRDQDPDNDRARALDLWLRYAHGRSFLPALRQERHRRAGLRLLAKDSTNAMAHLLLGAIQLDLYRNQKDRVSIPVRYADGNVMDLVIGYLDPRREDGRDLGIVRDATLESSYSWTAERHLRAAFLALDTPMQSLAAFRLAELALLTEDASLGREAARAMRTREPDDPTGYALDALFQYRSSNATAAWQASLLAVDRMDPVERTALLDRSPVEAPSVAGSERDWLDDDPRWETPENERLTEHVARRTALQLLGYPAASDPGRMILRYGLPTESVRFSSDRDAFMAVSYPFTTFIFHDMAKTGDWIFWSASAADLTGPRNVVRQWQRDQTIHAAEQFEARPFQSSAGPTGIIPLHAAIHGFGPRDQREWVVGWCAELRDGQGLDSVDHVGLYAAGTGPAVSTDSVPVRTPDVVAEWTVDLVRAPVDAPQAGLSDSPSTAVCRPVFRTVQPDAQHDRFSLEMRDRQGRMGAVRMRTAPIPDEGPVMSDLVLARLVTETEVAGASPPDGFIRRGGRLIEPLLPRRARRGTSVIVYFEVHDLNATVEIEAVLTPVDQRDRAAVSVSFTEDVDGGVWARDIILDLDGVNSGAYHLTVRVADIPGNLPALERSTTLEILSH